MHGGPKPPYVQRYLLYIGKYFKKFEYSLNTENLTSPGLYKKNKYRHLTKKHPLLRRLKKIRESAFANSLIISKA